MPKSTNYEKFLEFRKIFPWFSFDNFSFSLSQKGLEVDFVFSLSGQITFLPRLFVPRKKWFRPDHEIEMLLPNILFQIGMIEMVSYWKAACPPLVKILPGSLTRDQVAWWKRCYFNGLGEFFYLNSIGTTLEDFMVIEADGGPVHPLMKIPVTGGIVIPVGGGKDSAVTLELVGKQKDSIPMIMNPRGATLQTICQFGFGDQEYIEIHRTLDPGLLALNDQGFLNGHTPFSALLAFVAVLAAILSGRKYIALSNESSANETTIPGTTINHQYSKSLEFENDFRNYLRNYITTDIDYFSYLRPLSEMQIARLFAGFHKYHAVFRSCNAGSREDVWCGKCAKCLFTFIILSPFLSSEKMKDIFGKDLLDDMELLLLFDQLTGGAEEKPFDCVGTISEVNLALCEKIRQCGKEKLPGLLDYYRTLPLYPSYSEKSFREAIDGFAAGHHVTGSLLSILKSALHG
ncbi:MAG: hypothetical protein WCO93_07365 [bacterium]